MPKAAYRTPVLVLTLLGASAFAGDTFRCGSKLIEPGMTQSEVLAQCGEPTSRIVEDQDVRSGTRVVGTTR